jgi:hypothetical protein
MKSLVGVGSDSAGRQYFAMAGPAPVEPLPWGEAPFDALVFVAASTADSDVEATLRALIAANTDWIFTAGARAEFWHDRVDQLSVDSGRQQRGDRRPMTAWFEDIQSLDQWDTSYSFGGADYFLFIVVGYDVPASFRVREHATKQT